MDHRYDTREVIQIVNFKEVRYSRLSKKHLEVLWILVFGWYTQIGKSVKPHEALWMMEFKARYFKLEFFGVRHCG